MIKELPDGKHVCCDGDGNPIHEPGTAAQAALHEEVLTGRPATHPQRAIDEGSAGGGDFDNDGDGC